MNNDEPRSPGKARRLPPVCLLAFHTKLILGRVRFPKEHLGKVLEMDDGQHFTVFRHAHLKRKPCPQTSIFVVRFHFARRSDRTNRRLSVIPIPLIVGFPGFMDKLWMVNPQTGYWQGLYQFESPAAIAAYRRSFVLGLMNRRADPATLSHQVFTDTLLSDFLATRTKI